MKTLSFLFIVFFISMVGPSVEIQVTMEPTAAANKWLLKAKVLEPYRAPCKPACNETRSLGFALQNADGDQPHNGDPTLKHDTTYGGYSYWVVELEFDDGPTVDQQEYSWTIDREICDCTDPCNGVLDGNQQEVHMVAGQGWHVAE